MKLLKSLFVPFSPVDSKTLKLLFVGQAIILVALWFMSPIQMIPTPPEIFTAWDRMAREQGLLAELWTSTKTIWTAIALTAAIAFTIGCLSTAAFFKPISYWLTSFRFLGFAGVTFLFTLWATDGAQLKLMLLTFGMTAFMLTNTLASISSIGQEHIDYGHTLRLSNWRITYEMVVRGKLDEGLDLIRQNAAIGWTLLSMVEGIVRVEGGIGALLINQNKHLHLDAVFALQLTILVYGIFQDLLLRWIRNLLCPYVALAAHK